jgi:hypothetical protein
MSTPFATPASSSPAPGASPFDLADDPSPATAPHTPSAFDLTDEPTAPAPPTAPVAPAYDSSDPFAMAAAMPSPGNPPPAGSSGPAGGMTAGPPAPVAPADDARSRRQREIFDAILPVLGEFAAEVRRSVDYFRSRYPNDTLDQIMLCGGSARLPNLDQFLQNDLEWPPALPIRLAA